MPARTSGQVIALHLHKSAPPDFENALAPEVAAEIANLVVAMGEITADDFRVIVKVIQRLEEIQSEKGRAAALLAARKISGIILGLCN